MPRTSSSPSLQRHGGQALHFTVTAEDQYNNTATGYTGTVHFTSSDTAAVLPANSTFWRDDGVDTFSGATLKTAGSQTLTATDTVTTSLTRHQQFDHGQRGGGHPFRGGRAGDGHRGHGR